jgi:hypothetical protein
MEKISLKPATPVYSTRVGPAQEALPSLSLTSLQAGKDAQKSPLGEDFRNLMTVMMLGMGMGTSGQPGAGASGMGVSEMMAPLMLVLLEKLLAQQVETEEVGQVEAKEQVEQVAVRPNPQGMPIDGYLTQGSRSGHVALDFGAPVGTPVKATMDGKVVYAGWNDEGYGNLVIVENGPYRTYFAHLSKLPVELGQEVRAGSVVGLSGNTGNSTGPHLHYEVRKNGQHINPSSFTLA